MPYPPTFDRETIMPSTAFTADDRDFGARQLAKAHEIAAEPWNYGATDLEHAFITLHSSLAEHPYSLPFEFSCVAGPGGARVDVERDGTVNIVNYFGGGNANYLSLHGISFQSDI